MVGIESWGCDTEFVDRILSAVGSGTVRLAIAQIDSTVADFAGNVARIREAHSRAGDSGADLVLTPELSICGYPPLDLLRRSDFLEASDRALSDLANSLDGPPLIVGGPRRDAAGGLPRNSVFWLEAGEIRGFHDKRLLPTYDVFDEGRYFAPGQVPTVWEIAGCRVGVAICEEVWDPRGERYPVDPIEELRRAGVDLVISPSSSPFRWGKRRERREIYREQASRLGAPIVLVNQVGANTELLFDGTSLWCDSDGVHDQAPSFVESLEVWSLDSNSRDPSPDGANSLPEDPVEAIASALVMGIEGYFRKCAIDHAWVGLSGGIDSALVAALATEALGPDRVHGVAMPSRYSSAGSLADARSLAERLGIEFLTIPIEPAHQGFAAALQGGIGEEPEGLTDENLQARIRGTLLMALSNSRGGAVLATGNKSEVGVGYCTLYGDMCGALAPIGDVTKGLVYELARLPRFAKVIPVETIEKPPSAELRPDQLDTDSLPDYEQLDPILTGWIEEEASVEELISVGNPPDTVRSVVSMLETNEYKRAQAAPILRVSGRAFGVGRRVPLARGKIPHS